MGGIADYSGSLVLEKAIHEKTSVHFKFRNDSKIIAKTFSSEENEPVFEIDFATFFENNIIDFEKAKKIFKSTAGGSWAAYAIGCILVLQKEKGIVIKGCELEVYSTIPEGKGVSSSAALEIATFKALSQAYKVDFMGTEMPKLAQFVENQIVGAPCGLMDQIACTFGKPNEILPIICQPDQILNPIKLPDDLYFVGIDSGIRHHVEGASYSDVRTAAYMGYSIIASKNNTSIQEILNCRKLHSRENMPYNGYLANISTESWLKKYELIVPEIMDGASFIGQFGNTIDATTTVNPNIKYRIRACTAHPIFEFERISLFQKLLEELPSQTDKDSIYQKLGKLMFESHESYSSVQLGNNFTNRLVQMVKDKQKEGVFGAKITGGGSGGTVCILAFGEKGLKTAKQIHKEYQLEIKKEVKIFV